MKLIYIPFEFTRVHDVRNGDLVYQFGEDESKDVRVKKADLLRTTHNTFGQTDLIPGQEIDAPDETEGYFTRVGSVEATV